MRFEGEDDEGLLKRCSIPQESGVFLFDYQEKLIKLSNAIFGKETSQITNRMFGEAVAKMVLSLHAGDVVDEPYAKDENWVAKAKAYISANYHRRLTVEQIAEFLHIDRQYLRNLFVKYTGMSTKAYLDAYRMSRAAELLEMNGGGVNIVALSVGYADALAFSKAFKKHYGVSPSKYAELNKHKK